MTTTTYDLMKDAALLADYQGIFMAFQADRLALENFAPVRNVVFRAAEAARKSGIFNSETDQAAIEKTLQKYKAMPKATVFNEFWMHYLDKFFNAPSQIQKVGAVTVFMPMLDDLLNHFSDTPNAAEPK